MESDITYKAFFVLLRAGLWNRDAEDDCFPLSPKIWERVYRLARKQTVEGIVYDGMIRLPDQYLPPRNLLLKWVVEINTIETINKRMTKNAGELYEFFTQNGIAAFLMKGQGVAAYYDNPLHRVCGDIDWCFPDRENYDRANRLIKQSNIPIEKQAGFSTCYTWKGFLIEHHRHLLDISNPFISNYLRRMQQQEFGRSVYLDAGGRKVALPSPVLTHLSVNSHILKHLLSFGISVRQLCDSACVCRTYHSKEEAESLEKIYRKLGIYRWIQMLNTLLVNYLGMPEKYLPFPLASQQKAEIMMNDVLQGGNFGFYGGPLLQETDEPQKERKNTWLHLLIRFGRYVGYAPKEAFWFPVMHSYSNIHKWFVR